MTAEKLMRLLSRQNFDTVVCMYPIATATYGNIKFQLTGYTPKKLLNNFDFKSYYIDCWHIRENDPHGEFLKSINVSSYASMAHEKLNSQTIDPMLLLATIFEVSDFLSEIPMTHLLSQTFTTMKNEIERDNLTNNVSPVGVIAGKRKAL